jgi:hypothetical protein
LNGFELLSQEDKEIVSKRISFLLLKINAKLTKEEESLPIVS